MSEEYSERVQNADVKRPYRRGDHPDRHESDQLDGETALGARDPSDGGRQESHCKRERAAERKSSRGGSPPPHENWRGFGPRLR